MNVAHMNFSLTVRKIFSHTDFLEQKMHDSKMQKKIKRKVDGLKP